MLIFIIKWNKKISKNYSIWQKKYIFAVQFSENADVTFFALKQKPQTRQNKKVLNK